MHEAERMSVVECLGDLADDRRDELRRQTAALAQDRPEVGLDEQHRDVENAAILASSIQGNDVRMTLEYCEGTSFGDESPAVALVVRNAAG